MTTETRANDVASYATAVRAALADLPAEEQTALLEDLEDHLAEIAAEADGTLVERLGPPETYGAELRAAYGAVHGQGGRRALPRQAMLASMAVRLRQAGWYRDVRAFLPSLRPAWWVARGYLVVLLLTVMFSSGFNVRPIPNPFRSSGLLQLIATIIAIVISVRLGQRSRPRNDAVRLVGILGNTAIALLAIPMLHSMSTTPFPDSAPVSDSTPSFPGAYAGGGVTNIYPYSRDGKPLTDVLLYDQDGRPLVVDAKGAGLTTADPTGADGQPITNAYPQSQRQFDGTPVVRPRAAIPPWPTPSPSASPTSTP